MKKWYLKYYNNLNPISYRLHIFLCFVQQEGYYVGEWHDSQHSQHYNDMKLADSKFYGNDF